MTSYQSAVLGTLTAWIAELHLIAIVRLPAVSPAEH